MPTIGKPGMDHVNASHASPQAHAQAYSAKVVELFQFFKTRESLPLRIVEWINSAGMADTNELNVPEGFNREIFDSLFAAFIYKRVK